LGKCFADATFRPQQVVVTQQCPPSTSHRPQGLTTNPRLPELKIRRLLLGMGQRLMQQPPIPQLTQRHMVIRQAMHPPTMTIITPRTTIRRIQVSGLAHPFQSIRSHLGSGPMLYCKPNLVSNGSLEDSWNWRPFRPAKQMRVSAMETTAGFGVVHPRVTGRFGSASPGSRAACSYLGAIA
jgi:hypothetical protein